MRALRLAAMSAYRALFGMRRTHALAEGWRVMRQHPEVLRDLTVLGHVFEPDIDPETGRLYPPDELVARCARRSFALMLIARGEITHDEMALVRQETRNDLDADADEDR